MHERVITVFTEGDSNQLSTWSNVPYFFTRTFEKKGYKVNRVDVSPNIIISKFYNKFILKLLRMFYNKKSEYYFHRTSWHDKIVERKMKKAVEKYSDTDYFISTSFSFTPWLYTNKKKILFCDWTIDYYYSYFLNRKPDKLESSAIRRQEKYIKNSDYVISLFPNVAEKMQEKYGKNKVYYLGNVINSDHNIDKSEIIKAKLNSHSIIFIGGEKYIEGAKSLIKAYEQLKTDYPTLTVNIIGIGNERFRNLPKGINCYGYLNKSKESDNELYYQLIKEAKIFVNTTPKWAAFSATVEALYWYTPVITTPYNSFIETFGENIDFGYYCSENDPNLICKFISEILELKDEKYLRMCTAANKEVQQFTWDYYIDKVIDTIKN